MDNRASHTLQEKKKAFRFVNLYVDGCSSDANGFKFMLCVNLLLRVFDKLL